jgi:hypothetical protein
VSGEFCLGLSMFLELAHTRLTVFTYSEKLVIACYLLTRLFMAMKLNFISAAQTAHLKEIIIQTFKLLTGMLK